MSYDDKVKFILDGREYRWIGGLGAQLESIEDAVPEPGTMRYIADRPFYLFHGRRRHWWHRKCDLSWSIARNGKRTLDEDQAEIEALKKHLASLF